MTRTILLTAIAAMASTASAYSIYSFFGTCVDDNNQAIQSVKIDASSGCQQGQMPMFFGRAEVKVVSDPDKDFGGVVVFFRSGDCRPTNEDIILFSEGGCHDIQFGSYEVWDLWKE